MNTAILTPDIPATSGTTFLDLAEIAALLHVTPQTLRRWRTQQASSFPSQVRIGRRLLFDAAEVQAFLARLREGKV
jgi:predicted DNA-binding transcriptional regulator AlpA